MNYERDYSHSHCFESDNPPCGIKGKHRCCLCEKSYPTTDKREGMREEYLAKFKCIDSSCDGKGNCNPHLDADENWIPDQCQYCFEIRFPTADLLSQSFQEGREMERRELRELIEEWPRRIKLILPEGKLPFVVWQGKADESEKWTIYEQAFRDILSLIDNTQHHGR